MPRVIREKDLKYKGNFYLATAFEAESIEFDTTAHKFEKEVDSVQRDIAKVEDQLDIAISSTKVNYVFIFDQKPNQIRKLAKNSKSPTRRPLMPSCKLVHSNVASPCWRRRLPVPK